ncbi:GGDEF domain-containing protein, partial [Mesorhizobium sp. M2D.F.Ca.ET.160.01.1.1]
MGSADFILMINMLVAALLAAAFMAVAVYGTGRVAARWLAFSSLLGMAYFAIEF